MESVSSSQLSTLTHRPLGAAPPRFDRGTVRQFTAQPAGGRGEGERVDHDGPDRRADADQAGARPDRAGDRFGLGRAATGGVSDRIGPADCVSIAPEDGKQRLPDGGVQSAIVPAPIGGRFLLRRPSDDRHAELHHLEVGGGALASHALLSEQPDGVSGGSMRGAVEGAEDGQRVRVPRVGDDHPPAGGLLGRDGEGRHSP
eukprot:1671831-Prymnesium_polylepis.1